MIRMDGRRLYLKTWTREEYHAFFQNYVSDPIMDPKPYVYDRERVDRAFDTVSEREVWYPRLGIFLHRGDAPIGELSIKRIDREKSRCELGIMLASDEYKGQGYGTEALRLAIEYAFTDLGLSSIFADTMGSNHVMRHILEKLGFEMTGREERRYDMGGRWEDRLDYVLRNPNFQQ